MFMTILDIFSYISEEDFCSRIYDVIKILKMDLYFSKSVKIDLGVSGRCKHTATDLERYYSNGLKIVYPSLSFF